MITFIGAVFMMAPLSGMFKTVRYLFFPDLPWKINSISVYFNSPVSILTVLYKVNARIV